MSFLVIKTFCDVKDHEVRGAELALAAMALNVDFTVLVIYMDYQKQGAIIPKILELNTQSVYGQNINLDALLIQPSIQEGLSALIISQAQKTKLVNAASNVSKEHLTMGYGDCLEDIAAFLQANNEKSFVADRLISNRLEYISIQSNDPSSLSANLGSKLFVTNYMAASGKIGRILTSLNWLIFFSLFLFLFVSFFLCFVFW